MLSCRIINWRRCHLIQVVCGNNTYGWGREPGNVEMVCVLELHARTVLRIMSNGCVWCVLGRWKSSKWPLGNSYAILSQKATSELISANGIIPVVVSIGWSTMFMMPSKTWPWEGWGHSRKERWAPTSSSSSCCYHLHCPWTASLGRRRHLVTYSGQAQKLWARKLRLPIDAQSYIPHIRHQTCLRRESLIQKKNRLSVKENLHLLTSG